MNGKFIMLPRLLKFEGYATFLQVYMSFHSLLIKLFLLITIL